MNKTSGITPGTAQKMICSQFIKDKAPLTAFAAGEQATKDPQLIRLVHMLNGGGKPFDTQLTRLRDTTMRRATRKDPTKQDAQLAQMVERLAGRLL